jgi:hypothetical protein
VEESEDIKSSMREKEDGEGMAEMRSVTVEV